MEKHRNYWLFTEQLAVFANKLLMNTNKDMKELPFEEKAYTFYSLTSNYEQFKKMLTEVYPLARPEGFDYRDHRNEKPVYKTGYDDEFKEYTYNDTDMAEIIAAAERIAKGYQKAIKGTLKELNKFKNEKFNISEFSNGN